MARGNAKGRGHYSPDPSRPPPRSYVPKHLRNDDFYDSGRPSKRRRTEEHGNDPDEHYDNYRPHNTHPSTKHPKSAVPSHASQKSSTHTHQSRKSNRSTRIHSLRNLLARDSLPPQIKIEKERELAGLLFDQQKDKLKSESSKMITRYHKVRFFERKKAERKLNQLVRRREGLVRGGGDGGIEGDPTGEEDRVQSQKDRQKKLKDLEQQIRGAKVDLNYTIYSPLNAKYISLFAHGPDSQKSGQAEEPKVHLMKNKQQKMLSREQKAELQSLQEESVGLTRLNGKTEKPPGWWEVERIMYPNAGSRSKSKRKHDDGSGDAMDVEDGGAEREAEVQKKLELLREGKLLGVNHNVPLDRELAQGQTRAAVESRKGKLLDKNSNDKPEKPGKTTKPEVAQGGKRKRHPYPPAISSWGPKPGKESWMNETGHIDPADIDSSSDEGGARLQNDLSDDSESESDGDGGFFER